jgi:hypothetical protein
MQIRYQLRDKEPTTPRDAQTFSIRIDKNMQMLEGQIFMVSQGVLLPKLMRRRRRKLKIKSLLMMALRSSLN